MQVKLQLSVTNCQLPVQLNIFYSVHGIWDFCCVCVFFYFVLSFRLVFNYVSNYTRENEKKNKSLVKLRYLSRLERLIWIMASVSDNEQFSRNIEKQWHGPNFINSIQYFHCGGRCVEHSISVDIFFSVRVFVVDLCISTCAIILFIVFSLALCFSGTLLSAKKIWIFEFSMQNAFALNENTA